MSERNVTIWAAVGPKGEVLKSSISAFRAVANRWAAKHRRFHVEKLGEVPVAEIPTMPVPQTSRARYPIKRQA